MVGIAEFLDAPDSALLIAIDGDVNLVTTRHETPLKLVVERFPLGPVANIDAVLALLGAQSLAMPAPLPEASRPALAATDDLTCADCGASFVNRSGLSGHRRAKHGKPTKALPVPETTVTCELCTRAFKNRHAMEVHLGRAHAAPAVAAPVTQQATEEPDPVSVDVVPLLALPVPSEPVATKRTAVVAGGSCPVCHEPFVSHEECDRCNVLIGPSHETERSVFITGLNLCRDCARTHAVARKREAAAVLV